MQKEDNKILKHNHGKKSIKPPFIIHSDLEYILKNGHLSNNPEKSSSTTEINKHTPSRYSLFTYCLFDAT